MMKGRLAPCTFLVAITALFDATAARAADPTKAECLAASDASLKTANEHKLRAERSALLVCASSTCPGVIRKECVDRVAEVNGQLPTLLVDAKDSAGGDLTAVRVTMDGEVLTEQLDGTAIAVDPGAHTFSFMTPGQPPITKKFLIEEGQKGRRESITFGAPVTPLPSAPPLPSAAPEATGWGAQRVAAVVAGGVGVVGIGIGAAMGAVALSDKSAAQNACPGATCPTQAGSNKWSSANSAAGVATVGWIVGGVGIAGAAVLWFTAPRVKHGPSTQIGVGPGSLQLRGSW